jgi:hypothetical protein
MLMVSMAKYPQGIASIAAIQQERGCLAEGNFKRKSVKRID